MESLFSKLPAEPNHAPVNPDVSGIRLEIRHMLVIGHDHNLTGGRAAQALDPVQAEMVDPVNAVDPREPIVVDVDEDAVAGA